MADVPPVLPGLSNSMSGLYPTASKGDAGTSQVLKDLSSTVTRGRDTMTQISTSAKELNSLFTEVRKSGNEEAVSGFKNYVISTASGMNSSDLDNFVKMGGDAVKQKETDLFTGLLSAYQGLSENRGAATGNAMMSEAGATHRELGTEAVRAFSDTAAHISNVADRGKDNLPVTQEQALSEFVSAWKQVRSAETATDRKVAQTSNLADSIKEKSNMLDIVEIARELRRQAILHPPIIHG